MHIQSRRTSISFKLLLVGFGILGLLMSFGVFEGRFDSKVFSYFTVLSNLLCTVYFIGDLFYLTAHPADGGSTWSPALKGIATMSITVTLLVAHFLLGARFSMGSASGRSMLVVHYIVPIMTIADWLLFDKKGSIQKISPFIWTLGPLTYFGYIVISAQMGGIYPYPFINVAQLGWEQVLRNVLLLVLFFVALGYLFFAVERLLIKVEKACHAGAPQA
jgi:hypothetical protein